MRSQNRRSTDAQRRKVKRVMHEYKHGTLRTSAGTPVRSRKQAIAIALNSARNGNRRKKT